MHGCAVSHCVHRQCAALLHGTGSADEKHLQMRFKRLYKKQQLSTLTMRSSEPETMRLALSSAQAMALTSSLWPGTRSVTWKTAKELSKGNRSDYIGQLEAAPPAHVDPDLVTWHPQRQLTRITYSVPNKCWCTCTAGQLPITNWP